MKRGEGGAAIEKIEEQRKPEDFFGYRNPARSDNPEVGGSSPPPATRKNTVFRTKYGVFITFRNENDCSSELQIQHLFH